MKKILTLTQKGARANLYKFERQPLSLSLSLSRSRALKIFGTAFATLALLIGGGFLISQNKTDTAQAVDYVWQTTFADNFDRTDGPIGNDWAEQISGVSTIENGQLKVNGNNGGEGFMSNKIVRPLAESTIDQAISLDVKLSDTNLDHFATFYGAGIVGRAQSMDINGLNGLYELRLLANEVTIVRRNGPEGTAVLYDNWAITTDPTHTYRLSGSFIGQNPTTIQFTVTDLTADSVVDNITRTDSAASLQTAGLIGFMSASITTGEYIYVDNVNLSSPDQVLGISSTNDNVEFGDTITWTITDDEDRTIDNFSDAGAGGTFSPTSVQLNTGNSYTATVTYTPAKSGQFEITADVSGGETFEAEIGVWPYSTTIGYIGDSISRLVGNVDIADGFTTVNKAVNAAASSDYANDYYARNWEVLWPQGTPIMTDAIDAFQSAGVEIVSIMLGTNDVGLDNRSVADYKANMETIIDRLKADGFKHVILNQSIYQAGWEVGSTRVAEYNAVLAELVDEYDGFALMGDEQGYEWFKANQSALGGDGLHPTAEGSQQLGEFWANAIKADLEYQINPDTEWLAADNEFDKDSDPASATLTFTVDKYFDEFTGLVKVDGVALTDSVDYTATAGSTVIELLNSYLNTLTAGTHTLTVAFNGGVTASSQFTILAANTGGNNGGNTGGGSTNPNTPFSPTVPNTGFSNLGKFVSENRGAVLAGLGAVIVGLGVSISLVGRKLASKS
jgi:lysophospholipase L1-like esterase/plastocyanin